jgi:hypothetical protein
MQVPARTLKDAFNACDPVQPLAAGDQRYVDLSPGRGDEGGAVSQCLRRIVWSANPLAQLFAGHRGCGKSTELRRLQRDLEQAGYSVVYIEAETDIDLEDTQPTDILLALIRSLDLALRAKDLAVDAKLLDDFLLWFAEIVLEKSDIREIQAEVRTEAEVKGGVPLFAKLLARFSGWVKTGTESKKSLRQRLDPQISQLLQRTRNFTQGARLAAQKKGAKDLVLIVDSLDRVALKELDDGRSSHEVIFIERGELLKGLGCHTVYTVPISLLFSPRLPNLSAIFPDRHVVPMVKIASLRTREPWAEGRALVLELLAHRLDLEVIFEPGAAEMLVEASGGHPRHLITLARYAFDFTEDLPVTKLAAERASQRLVNDYGRAIPEHHWELLARVWTDQVVKNDSDHQQMLFNLSVLEYQNEERWCDVHPAVLELPQFQKARTALERQS